MDNELNKIKDLLENGYNKTFEFRNIDYRTNKGFFVLTFTDFKLNKKKIKIDISFFEELNNIFNQYNQLELNPIDPPLYSIQSF